MGLFSRNPDERTVKAADESALLADRGPTMHETHAEWHLMAGKGGLITLSGGRVKVAGEKPGGGKQR